MCFCISDFKFLITAENVTWKKCAISVTHPPSSYITTIPSNRFFTSKPMYMAGCTYVERSILYPLIFLLFWDENLFNFQRKYLNVFLWWIVSAYLLSYFRNSIWKYLHPIVIISLLCIVAVYCHFDRWTKSNHLRI